MHRRLNCCIVGQGQPRVIIYICFRDLKSQMLHAKLQNHRTSGSREDTFLRFLPYMGLAARRPSWSSDLDYLYKLSFPLPIGAPYETGLWLAKRFRRSRQKSNHGYTISSPGEPAAQVS